VLFESAKVVVLIMNSMNWQHSIIQLDE